MPRLFCKAYNLPRRFILERRSKIFFVVEYKHWTKYTHNGHIVKEYTLHHCIINSKWYTSVPDDIGKYYTTGWIELISVEECNLKNGEMFEYSMGGPTG